MAALIDSPASAVTVAEVTEALTKAYNTTPSMKAAGSLDDFVGAKSGWYDCQHDNGMATDPWLSRQEACAGYIVTIYTYASDARNLDGYHAAQAVYWYAIGVLPMPYRQQLIDDLRKGA